MVLAFHKQSASFLRRDKSREDLNTIETFSFSLTFVFDAESVEVCNIFRGIFCFDIHHFLCAAHNVAHGRPADGYSKISQATVQNKATNSRREFCLLAMLAPRSTCEPRGAMQQRLVITG